MPDITAIPVYIILLPVCQKISCMYGLQYVLASFNYIHIQLPMLPYVVRIHNNYIWCFIDMLLHILCYNTLNAVER